MRITTPALVVLSLLVLPLPGRVQAQNPAIQTTMGPLDAVSVASGVGPDHHGSRTKPPDLYGPGECAQTFTLWRSSRAVNPCCHKCWQHPAFKKGSLPRCHKSAM